MDRLHTQYHRLYQPCAEAPAFGPGLIGADGRVRTLVLALRQPADWAALAPVWRGVQADLDWPAPGIVVNGVDAFELWFSLAQPVPLGEAVAGAQALVARYLGGLRPARLRCWPSAEGAPWSAPMAPAHLAAERWSAFVAPDLAAVFDGDDPALDLPPGQDAQADLLSRLGSVRPAGWQALLAWVAQTQTAPADPSGPAPGSGGVGAGVGAGALAAHTTHPGAGPARLQADAGGPPTDPRRFLLAVMGDAGVPLALRIQAASALLPHPPAC